MTEPVIRALFGLVAVAGAIGCGERSPAIGEAGAEAEYQQSAQGRVIVARVNGEPIYGDCVAAQMAARAIDRRQALDECIDFELLAQAARERGYLSNPAVVATSRREAVRALIDADYPLQKPADIPRPDIEDFWRRRIQRDYNHPELRTVMWCRLPLDRQAPPAKDASASRLAAKIHAAAVASPQSGAEALHRICREHAGDAVAEGLVVQDLQRRVAEQGIDPAFGGAAFGLPAIGAIAAPVRTPWGWDVIALAAVEPPIGNTLDDVLSEVQNAVFDRPELEWYREKTFEDWIRPLEARHRIERFDERMPEPAI
jgi:hypothetical protein